MMNRNPSDYQWKNILETDAEIVQRGIFMDGRGSFQKPFVTSLVESRPHFSRLREVNISHSTQAGTVRGFHLQANPYSETKLVTCISGKILDVIIDCREESTSYGQVLTIPLEANDGKSILIPKGYAHGFQTLEANSVVLYFVDEKYTPESQLGINPLSQEVKAIWPLPVNVISSQDENFPEWNEFMKKAPRIN